MQIERWVRLAPLDEHAGGGKAYAHRQGAHVQNDVGEIGRPFERLQQGAHGVAADGSAVDGGKYPDRLDLAAFHDRPKLSFVIVG